MGINEQAEAGFGRGAATYERGRPSYPADAIDVLVRELGIGPDRDVLDLAAGTGKLTRLLVPTGARLVAVEPVAAMADQLRTAVPGVEVHDGTAEAIPLPDGSVDAVVVGQAFHWFDAPVALAEIARVLRPGGGLGLIWNERDSSVPWVAELTARSAGTSATGGRVPYTLEEDWVAPHRRPRLGVRPGARVRHDLPPAPRRRHPRRAVSCPPATSPRSPTTCRPSSPSRCAPWSPASTSRSTCPT